MIILGINAFHAGASAALLIDGQPVFAAAEERFNRKKYYAGFPAESIRAALKFAGLEIKDVDAVAIGHDKSANRLQKIGHVLTNPTGLLQFAKMRYSRRPVEDLRSLLANHLGASAGEMRFREFHVEHHLAHIASAYFISPWEDGAGFSVDGSGDFCTAMLADCRGNRIDIKKRVFVPHSLGWLYTLICEFIGYPSYGDEGKVMGLAPYGENRFKAQFDSMVDLQPDGFELNQKYLTSFGTDRVLTITDSGEMSSARHYSDYLIPLFGEPRQDGSEITQRDMDLACGVQYLFERCYMHMLKILHRVVPSERVAMAGGCVLNSVANGKLFDETPFRDTCIQPAAGDEGLALGAALYASNVGLTEGKRFILRQSYLGPEFTGDEIRSELGRHNIDYQLYDREELLRETARIIAGGDVVGWFQGRMEWGPRALGNRSILVHPGLPNMKETLNARIKRREWFRPFAPAVLADRQSEIFENSYPSPFMLHVFKIRPGWRERLVAVTHVDGTGRLQSVAREENALFYDLIGAFAERTGIPVLLNTSFNENEPVVCTPKEAVDCFLRTRMDVLAIGSFICRKDGDVREQAE